MDRPTPKLCHLHHSTLCNSSEPMALIRRHRRRLLAVSLRCRWNLCDPCLCDFADRSCSATRRRRRQSTACESVWWWAVRLLQEPAMPVAHCPPTVSHWTVSLCAVIVSLAAGMMMMTWVVWLGLQPAAAAAVGTISTVVSRSNTQRRPVGFVWSTHDDRYFSRCPNVLVWNHDAPVPVSWLRMGMH